MLVVGQSCPRIWPAQPAVAADQRGDQRQQQAEPLEILRREGEAPGRAFEAERVGRALDRDQIVDLVPDRRAPVIGLDIGGSGEASGMISCSRTRPGLVVRRA
jgi:hypothetical protein